MHNELNAYDAGEEVDLAVTQENILQVIPEFSIWYNSVDKRNISVGNTYKLVDQLEESNPKVFQWEPEHENDFAEICLGADLKVTHLFEATILNGNSKSIYLVKRPSGLNVPKADAEVIGEGISYLAEEEIKENWSYSLFKVLAFVWTKIESTEKGEYMIKFNSVILAILLMAAMSWEIVTDSNKFRNTLNFFLSLFLF